MAPRIQFKMNGFRQVRTSAKVEAELNKQAERIADEANQSSGGGYVARVNRGTNRSRASVVTSDDKSVRDNARNNTLARKTR